MTLPEMVLIGAPALPVTAAAAIAIARPVGERSSRWAVRAASVAFVAAVVVAVVVAVSGPVAAVVDFYRADGDRIVEHWDVIQPWPAQSANDHPMF